MTDKEKLDAIRAEILRLVDVRGYDREMANDLLTFMGSLPNEPVSEELEKIVEEIAEPTILNAYGTKELARRLRNTIGISVSEDLEEAAKIYTLDDSIKPWRNLTKEAFIAGAKWQSKQFEKDYTNLCNGIATAKGLAVAMAYDKGVAYTKEQMMKNIWKPAEGPDLPIIDREVVALLDNGKVVFAHRPNPEGWDGKSVTTGKVEHYTPKTYDKGGWNTPNVKYWLDCLMPKEIEL